MFAALSYCLSSFFVTASTAAILSTLSLHDALPIYIDRDEWPGRLFPKVKQLPQNPVLLLYGAQLAQLILQKDVLTLEIGIGRDRLTINADVGERFLKITQQCDGHLSYVLEAAIMPFCHDTNGK